MKRLFTLVLCLVMILAVMPVRAVEDPPADQPQVFTSFHLSAGAQIGVAEQANDNGSYNILDGDIIVGVLPEGLNNQPNNEGDSMLWISPTQGYGARYYVSDSEVADITTIDIIDWMHIDDHVNIENVSADKFLYIVFYENRGPGDGEPLKYRVTVEVIGQGTVYGRLPDDDPGSYRLTVTGGNDDSIELSVGSQSLSLTWQGEPGYAIASTYQIVQPADGSTPPVNEPVPGDGSITVNAESDGVGLDTRIIITFQQDGEGPDGHGDSGSGPQLPQMNPFDLTINKPDNGTVYYYDADPDVGLVPIVDTPLVLEDLTEPFIVYLKPDAGYKVEAVLFQMADMAGPEDCSYLLGYDPDVVLDDEQGMVAVQLEFWDNTEVFFNFSPLTTADFAGLQFAILSSENNDDDTAIQAIRRELGLVRLDVPAESITIGPATDQMSDNGVPYITRTLEITLEPPGCQATVYIVDHVSNGIFISNGTYSDGSTGRKIYIYASEEPASQDARIGMQHFSVQPITQGTLDLFGPYNLRYIGSFSQDVADAFSMVENYRMEISRYFGRCALHIGNGASESILGTHQYSVNWYMMNLIQEDALAVQIRTGAAIGGMQGAHGLDLDNVADLTAGNVVMNTFFGNDTVYIELPANDSGDIRSLSVTEVNHPGYTIRMVDGSIEVFFKSNFYDRLTIPITITRKNGSVVMRNLTIIRTGIKFDQFIRSEGNPDSDIVSVAHGTQAGSTLNIRGPHSYLVVASYLIPDFGDTLPYGLLITRTYEDGSIETEIVRAPIDSPPAFINTFHYENGIYYYNEGIPDENTPSFIHDGSNANVADYLVFAGDENGRVPQTINVLVLKDNPAIENDGSFGGFFLGSGSGVEWKRPN